MIRLVLVAEFPDAKTEAEAEEILNSLREATWPEINYGMTIFRASEKVADTAIYAKDEED